MRAARDDGRIWLPCLVCGVDSGPVLTFFFWIVGCGVLGFIALGVWAYLTGKLRPSAAAKRPLQVEANEEY